MSRCHVEPQVHFPVRFLRDGLSLRVEEELQLPSSRRGYVEAEGLIVVLQVLEREVLRARLMWTECVVLAPVSGPLRDDRRVVGDVGQDYRYRVVQGPVLEGLDGQQHGRVLADREVPRVIRRHPTWS